MKLPTILSLFFVFLALLPKPALAAGCGCTLTGQTDYPGCITQSACPPPCTVSGATVKQDTCVVDWSGACPVGPTQWTHSTATWTCPNQAAANCFCGIAPPPGGTVCGNGICESGETSSSCPSDCSGSSGTCSPNCGTYPNCYSCSVPPSNNYGCNGNSCQAGFGSDGPGCASSGGCAPQTCVLTNQIVSSPVEAGQGIQFKFIEGGGPTNKGYVCVDLRTGGGTDPGCQNSNGYTPAIDSSCNSGGSTCSWTYGCTAVSSTPQEYTTYNGTFTAFLANSGVGGSGCPPPSYDANCTVNFQYVVHGCTKPTAPANPNPNNNATDVSVTPTLRWTQSNWGSRGPYSAMVYLFQGNSGSNATNPYSVCYLDGADIGAPGNTTPSAPMSCFVWSGNLSGSGYYQGQSVGALKYNQQYSWFVVSYSGCGSQGNDATAFSGPGFITVPQNYFTTFGGNVTSHAIISNASLPSNSFVCQKSQ